MTKHDIDENQQEKLSSLLDSLDDDELLRLKDEATTTHLSRTLPILASKLNGYERFTPLEAELWKLTDIALKKTYAKLEPDEKVRKEYSKIPKAKKIKKLSEYFNANAGGDKHKIFQQIFAAQPSIRLFKLSNPPDMKTTKEILKRINPEKRDIFAGQPPDQVGSKFTFANGTNLPSKLGAYAITLTRSQTRPTQVLSRNYFVNETYKQESAYIIIYPQASLMEIRAPILDSDDLASHFTERLSTHGHKCAATFIPIDIEDVLKVKIEVGAVLSAEKLKNSEGRVNGLDILHLKVSSTYRNKKGLCDLLNSPDHKAITDKMKETGGDFYKYEWVLNFASKKGVSTEDHQVVINLRTGTLRFPKGNIDEVVIQDILQKLSFHRTEREKIAAARQAPTQKKKKK